MSLKAITWAFEQQSLSPGNKLLLLAMADVAGDTGKSHSSCETLCRMTGFSKPETISAMQNKLCELALIADTGKRVGITGRVRVFQFHPSACKERPSEDLIALFKSPGNTPPDAVLNTPPNTPPNTPSGGSCHIIGSRNKEQVSAGANPEVSEFINGWYQSYKETFSDTYVVNGPRDGRAIKGLLAASKISAKDLLVFAVAAWKRPDAFYCKSAVTICFFCSHFNEIKRELGRHENNSTNHKPTPSQIRNSGISGSENAAANARATVDRRRKAFEEERGASSQSPARQSLAKEVVEHGESSP